MNTSARAYSGIIAAALLVSGGSLVAQMTDHTTNAIGRDRYDASSSNAVAPRDRTTNALPDRTTNHIGRDRHDLSVATNKPALGGAETNTMPADSRMLDENRPREER